MEQKERPKVLSGKLSYKPLLRLLIEREMNTTELSKLAGISSSTMTEIRAHRSVTLETILKICVALGCAIEDVVEVELELEGGFHPTYMSEGSESGVRGCTEEEVTLEHAKGWHIGGEQDENR